MSATMFGAACMRRPLPATLRRPAVTAMTSRRAFAPTSRLTTSPIGSRFLTTSAVRFTTQPSQPAAKVGTDTTLAEYKGPLGRTFTRLKVFSLASLGLASVLTPILLLAPGEISMAGRLGLVVTALATSGVSTCLIAWIGTPYVGTMRLLRNSSTDTQDVRLQLDTVSWRLQPRSTIVYDPTMIRPTSRPFATWELTNNPPALADSANEVTKVVAETFDAKSGDSIGKWLVKYSTTPGAAGQTQIVGKPTRYFNVHEELLGEDWQVLG